MPQSANLSELFYRVAPVKQALVCRQKQRGVPLIAAELPVEGKVSKDFSGMWHGKTRSLSEQSDTAR